MDDNEIISIIAVVLLIIAFVMYVEIVKFAHFLGAGVGVTFWALITTIVLLPFIIFILRKLFLGKIKNKFFIFLSLPILWYNWGQVLLSHAKEKINMGFNTQSFSYLRNFNSLPWWGTQQFFWIIEIAFFLLLAVYITYIFMDR